MDPRAELRELLRKEAFQFGDFLLASGKRSNYYLDCKLATLNNPRALSLAAQLILDRIRATEQALGHRIDAIGGLTSGADPLVIAVSQLALQRGIVLPAFFVRDEQKSHGTKRVIEGVVKDGMRVAILDDVMTTGNSVLKAVRGVEQQGARAVKIVVLVDRQDEDRSDALAAYDWEPIFSVSELLGT